MPTREMFRGDTLIFDVQVLQPNGAPQDITGWKLWFTVKFNVLDPDVRAVSQRTTDSGGGIAVTDALSGKAEINMPSQATRNFQYGGPIDLDYDVQAKDPSGNVTTVEKGILTVKPDVTSAIA